MTTIPLTSDEAGCLGTEIFGHALYATTYDDPECGGNVFIVGGKDFESQPFKLYLTLEEAQSLLVQLGYHVFEREINGDT